VEPSEAAKRALISYRQLEAILKDGVGVRDSQAVVDTYDKVLETLKHCFSIDPAFEEAVKHVRKPDRADSMSLAYRLESDGKILLATAHAFIELYLSTEDKQKAIGFSA
jgi:hypothetical protein